MGFTVGGTFRPDPGTRMEDFQLPGPGSYEADFGVPDWLVPDFETHKQFSFSKDGHKITHLWTKEKDGVLTVRFDVARMENRTTLPETEAIPLLMGGIMAIIGAGILGVIAVVAFKSLKEIRLLVQSAEGKLALGGFGILLLGLGVFFAARGIRGG